jgi:tRNA 2-thiouridine synthesizing protein A
MIVPGLSGDQEGSVPPDFKETVDATGLACPLPILRAKKALATLAAGDVLRVITTDRGAVRDFQAFCKQTGNILLAQVDETVHVTHYLERRLK